jgi:cytochrome c oxidase cbb3-type subunit 2
VARLSAFVAVFFGLFVLSVAVCRGDTTSGKGAEVYSSRCAGCHGADGEGSPGLFPPLKGDPVVTAEDPAQHITTVLFGLRGKTIDGVAYPVAMPAHQSVLTDAEIAAVINYERTSWGNHARTVTAEDVGRIRNK